MIVYDEIQKPSIRARRTINDTTNTRIYYTKRTEQLPSHSYTLSIVEPYIHYNIPTTNRIQHATTPQHLIRYDASYTFIWLPHNNDNNITYKNKIHKHIVEYEEYEAQWNYRTNERTNEDTYYMVSFFWLLLLLCVLNAYACFTRISRIIFIQYGFRIQTHTHTNGWHIFFIRISQTEPHTHSET